MTRQADQRDNMHTRQRKVSGSRRLRNQPWLPSLRVEDNPIEEGFEPCVATVSPLCPCDSCAWEEVRSDDESWTTNDESYYSDNDDDDICTTIDTSPNDDDDNSVGCDRQVEHVNSGVALAPEIEECCHPTHLTAEELEQMSPEVRSQIIQDRKMLLYSMLRQSEILNTAANLGLWLPMNEAQLLDMTDSSAALEHAVHQALGNALYVRIHDLQPTLCAKITGMLLELEYSELFHYLKDPQALNDIVQEALHVLAIHRNSQGVELYRQISHTFLLETPEALDCCVWEALEALGIDDFAYNEFCCHPAPSHYYDTSVAWWVPAWVPTWVPSSWVPSWSHYYNYPMPWFPYLMPH